MIILLNINFFDSHFRDLAVTQSNSEVMMERRGIRKASNATKLQESINVSTIIVLGNI